MSAEALYDTGAAVTLISEEKFRCIPVDLRPKKREGPFLTLLGADKKPMKVKGCFDMPINLLNRNIKTQVFVVSDLSSDMILGTDFIRKEGLSYDAVGHRLFFDRTDQWQCGGMVASCEVTIKANSSQAIKVRHTRCRADELLAHQLQLQQSRQLNYQSQGMRASSTSTSRATPP